MMHEHATLQVVDQGPDAAIAPQTCTPPSGMQADCAMVQHSEQHAAAGEARAERHASQSEQSFKSRVPMVILACNALDDRVQASEHRSMQHEKRQPVRSSSSPMRSINVPTVTVRA